MSGAPGRYARWQVSNRALSGQISAELRRDIDVAEIF